MMRVNTNIPSLVTYNALTATNAGLQKSIQRLSTGLRINSAADDAAGLAISEKMRAQIKGIDRAVANAQDGISMIQTAEGAMNESHSILQRMRELAVQAANDALTMNDREYIQLEIDQLKTELDRISSTTQFNKKKLLDGSADVLWSTDMLGTNVIVNGNTVSVDQFGQKSALEGNFNVVANVAEMGQNQVLKSNILTVAIGDSVYAASTSTLLSDLTNFTDANGVNILDTPQTLTISFEGGGSAAITIYADDTVASLGEKLNMALAGASEIYEPAAVQYVTDGTVLPNTDDPILNELATNWLWGAGKRLAEAYGLTGNGGTLTIKFDDTLSDRGVIATGEGGWYADGETYGIITIDTGDFLANWQGQYYDNDRLIAHELTHVMVGITPGIAQMFMGFEANNGTAAYGDAMWLVEGLPEYIHGANARVIGDAAEGADLSGSGQLMNDLLNPGTKTYDDIYATNNFWSYSAAYLATRYFDEMSLANGGTGIKGLLGALADGSETTLDGAMNFASGGLFNNYASFKTAITGDTLVGIETYTNFLARVLAEDPNYDTGAIGGFYATQHAASGRNDPLSPRNVVEGNGEYSVNPLAEWGWDSVKWPDAMPGEGGANPGVVATAVPMDNTLQAVNGTLLLHSALLGGAGRMTVSGDEALINALGFTEVQSARDTVYDVTITDAHSGKLLTSGVKASGGTLYGLLHENIDITLTNNFGVGLDATKLRTEGYGSFKYEANGRNSFTVHIAANSSVLQIGANEGENMSIGFGDISCTALGVDKVSVRDRELATRAVTIVDNAITKVSTKRARLGAYQNRLEHTITNLTTSSTNTTAAESRIRDADMAKEMINFTKLNILSQAGNSMLGQANQIPQNVLTLMR